MNIKDIKLVNGTASYAEGRTLMSETGLPADTEVELIETVSRQTGTVYRNSIYKIVGKQDAIIIRHNDGPVDNIHWDNVELKLGFFAERQEYAKTIGDLSNKYRIPFEVCLALGNKEEAYPLFLAACANLDHVNIKTYRDLNAGIERKKSGIKEIVGDHLYELIKVEKWGQKNTRRVAEYVSARYEKEQEMAR